MSLTYFDHYRIYTSGNEASPMFHKWCGFSTLASAISRRVWVDQGCFNVFANLYVLLIGTPASGKSIAMNRAKTLIRAAAAMSPTNHPAIAPAAITKEAMTQLMGGVSGSKVKSACKQEYYDGKKNVEYSHLSVFSNEFVTLLGASPQNMLDFLTDVYDQPAFEVYTKNKSCDIIEGPYMNILACMTPTTGDALIQSKLINGGFTRRCNMINDSERGAPVPLPEETEEQRQSFAWLLSHIQSLAMTHGKFEWAAGTKEWFTEWYLKKHSVMLDERDIAMQGYYRSMDQMLLRLAMLHELAKPEPSLVLTLPSLVQALKDLEPLPLMLTRTLSGAGRNILATITERVVDYLRTTKAPVLRKKLNAIFWTDANTEEFTACVNHLLSSGRVRATSKPSPQGPVEYIELVQP